MCIEYQRGKRRSSGLGLMTAHCEFGVPVPLTNDPTRGSEEPTNRLARYCQFNNDPM